MKNLFHRCVLKGVLVCVFGVLCPVEVALAFENFGAGARSQALSGAVGPALMTFLRCITIPLASYSGQSRSGLVFEACTIGPRYS